MKIVAFVHTPHRVFTTAAHRGVHFHCGLIEWDEAAPLRHHHLLRTVLPAERFAPILTRAGRPASLRVEDWRARCAARDIPLLLPGQTLDTDARPDAIQGQLPLHFEEDRA